jgi:hypothetical protein
MTSLSQMLLMGAVVATMLFWPLGVALGLVLALCGVPVDAVATFGGTFGTLAGLFVWWLIVFVSASVYAAVAFPWGDALRGWPGKK